MPLLDLLQAADFLLRGRPGKFYMSRKVYDQVRQIIARRRRNKRRARYTRNRGFVRPRLRTKR